MTLRELALTLPCSKCGARPGEMCISSANVGRSVKGLKFFIHHKPRMNDARAVQNACCIPLEFRFTVTIALRALIVSLGSDNEGGCNRALECAHALGLDPDLVAKGTHLENLEVANV